MGCSSKRVFTDEQHRQCMANMSDIDYGYAKKMCACVKKGYESAKNFVDEVNTMADCQLEEINKFDTLFEL